MELLQPGFEGPYDYSFEYGAAAGYVLDVRSERRSADGNHARVFSPHQLERFATWLNVHDSDPLLFIVMSVPPFFMPGWLSRIARYVPGCCSSRASSKDDSWSSHLRRQHAASLATIGQS